MSNNLEKLTDSRYGHDEFPTQVYLICAGEHDNEHIISHEVIENDLETNTKLVTTGVVCFERYVQARNYMNDLIKQSRNVHSKLTLRLKRLSLNKVITEFENKQLRRKNLKPARINALVILKEDGKSINKRLFIN